MTGKIAKDTNVPSTDYISRQAAIDAMVKLNEEDLEDYGVDIPEAFNLDCLDRATYALRTLPSAQPRRLRGRWVETERRGVLAGAKYYKCDICAQAIVVVDSTPMAYGYNYCPRCGAQMEGQDG